MRNLFKGLISTTKSLGEKLENYTLIVDKVWFHISSNDQKNKTTYIFRSKNDELLISTNGVVEKGKWEYIKTSNCLLLDIKGVTKLYQVLYQRDNYLVFQNDFDPSLFVFVNESYYQNKYAKLGGKVLDYVLRDIGERQFFANEPIKEVRYHPTPKVVKVKSRPAPVEKPKPFVSEKPKPNIYEKPKEVKKDEPKLEKGELKKSIEKSMKNLDDIINDLENYKNRK